MRISINRSHRLFPILFAIAVIFTMSLSVWANKAADDNTVSATIKFSTATKVGNTQIAAGEYRVIADDNQAKFQKGNRVVAEIPCSLKPLSFMPRQTVYVTDSGKISEIQVAGSEMAIEFSTRPS